MIFGFTVAVGRLLRHHRAVCEALQRRQEDQWTVCEDARHDGMAAAQSAAEVVLVVIPQDVVGLVRGVPGAVAQAGGWRADEQGHQMARGPPPSLDVR